MLYYIFKFLFQKVFHNIIVKLEASTIKVQLIILLK